MTRSKKATLPITSEIVTAQRVREVLRELDSPVGLRYIAELLAVEDDPQAESLVCSTIHGIEMCNLCNAEDSDCLLKRIPIGFDSRDKTSATTYKLGTYLMKENRFYALSERSVIWMYSRETGFWKPNGSSFIQGFAADYLGENFKRHIANETETYVRYKSYNSNVTLGGPKDRIVVANGTYDLESHTFSGLFNPDEFHITGIAAHFNPDAECPTIKRFLKEVLNSEGDRKAIVEFFGYCLWKDYPFATIPMLLGEGANGKSTLLGLLKAFLGSHNVSGCSPQELTLNRFRSAQLHGKLANVAGDIPAKPIEYTGVIKMLTGRDLVTVEHKHRDPFDFENQAKLIFSANQLPAAYDQTDAFHRRIRLIDFPNTFSSEDPKTDPDILDKLTTPEELSGLLNLAIEGWKRLRTQGFLTGERSTEEKRLEYIRRSDLVEYFALRFLEHDVQAAPIEKSEVYAWYMSLCHLNNQMPVSDSWFSKRLRRIVSFLSEGQHRDGDRRLRVWNGVVLRYDLLAGEGIGTDTGGTGVDPLPDIQQRLQGSEQNTRATRARRANDRGYVFMVRRLAAIWKEADLDSNDPLNEPDLSKTKIKNPHEFLEECIKERLVLSQRPGQWRLTDLGRVEIVEISRSSDAPKFPRTWEKRCQVVKNLFSPGEILNIDKIKAALSQIYVSGYEDKVHDAVIRLQEQDVLEEATEPGEFHLKGDGS